MVNAQEWLDKNYPKKERKDFTKLEINDKNLEGDLNLSDFVNLKKLDCSSNQLTDLNLNYEKLTYLDISNNNFF